jgi:uncharacterized protein with ParB-like and HNH nuclease domain
MNFNPNKPRFQDIEPFMSDGRYSIDVSFGELENELNRYREECNLDINPDFQRGYVWTDEQKTKYVEFVLRRGKSSKEFLFNCAGFMRGSTEQMVLVDGKQRISACLDFLHNKIPAFGCYYSQFNDNKSSLCHNHRYSFKFLINDLETRQEVLEWYLQLNSGGTVHTEEDLNKVRKLLEQEKALVNL